MHVHASLLDECGNNVFADDNHDYNETLEYAIGGMLD